jgi:hypothetical protein
MVMEWWYERWLGEGRVKVMVRKSVFLNEEGEVGFKFGLLQQKGK